MGLKIELRNWKEFLEKFNFPSLEKWPQRAITHLDYFFTNYIVITIFFVIIVSLQDPICLLTPIPVIFIISTLYFLEKENVFKFENSKIRILIYCLAIILISGFFLLIVAKGISLYFIFVGFLLIFLHSSFRTISTKEKLRRKNF